MEKTRVRKGEIYWYVFFPETIVDYNCDWQLSIDNDNYNYGNYFHTKEEAEAMAKKIRKVLKGADVIEMPSEDEIEAKAYDISADWLEQDYMQVAYDAALKMADWLKSKILK